MLAANFLLRLLVAFLLLGHLDPTVLVVVLWTSFGVHACYLPLQSLMSALDLNCGLLFLVDLHQNYLSVPDHLAQVPRCLCHVGLGELV